MEENIPPVVCRGARLPTVLRDIGLSGGWVPKALSMFKWEWHGRKADQARVSSTDFLYSLK